MNLVEPGITVNVWDTYSNVVSPPPSNSVIEPLSLFEQFAIDLLSVQPMTGECGMLFKMRYEPKMMVKSLSHMADQYLPPVD